MRARGAGYEFVSPKITQHGSADQNVGMMTNDLALGNLEMTQR
jgi:hypothetical protein